MPQKYGILAQTSNAQKRFLLFKPMNPASLLPKAKMAKADRYGIDKFAASVYCLNCVVAPIFVSMRTVRHSVSGVPIPIAVGKIRVS